MTQDPTEAQVTTDDVPRRDPGQVSAAPSAELADTAAETPDHTADPARPSRRKRLEDEGDLAADYLERLLDIAELDGDIDMDVENDRATVFIDGEGVELRSLRRLVGEDGQVLEALQELVRLAVAAETGERSRLMLDIAGYRAERRLQLVEMAQRSMDKVKDGTPSVRLDPMSPFERKVIHDVVAEAGLRSESEGEGNQRHVVISAAAV